MERARFFRKIQSQVAKPAATAGAARLERLAENWRAGKSRTVAEPDSERSKRLGSGRQLEPAAGPRSAAAAKETAQCGS